MYSLSYKLALFLGNLKQKSGVMYVLAFQQIVTVYILSYKLPLSCGSVMKIRLNVCGGILAERHDVYILILWVLKHGGLLQLE